MLSPHFNRVIEEQLERCKATLVKKGGEYATDSDRLHNFVQAAHLQGISPREALAGMMAKHTVSVYDMAMSGKEYPIDVWDEKIGDHLNYLLLLRAMVEDEAVNRAEIESNERAQQVMRNMREAV